MEVRKLVSSRGERLALHLHHAPGDVPGSYAVLKMLEWTASGLSQAGASEGVLQAINAAVSVYGSAAPELLVEKAADGSVDALVLQTEPYLETAFLYPGASFLDAGRKLTPAVSVPIPMPVGEIKAPAYWRLGGPVPSGAEVKERLALVAFVGALCVVLLAVLIGTRIAARGRRSQAGR